MDFINLRTKTIFDFCDDITQIQQFIPSVGTPEFDMEEYRAFCAKNPTSNALHLTLLANVLCSNELSQAVQREFAAELQAFFAEK